MLLLSCSPSKEKALTFSNTQTWNLEWLESASVKELRYLPKDWRTIIKIDPAPSNISVTTQRDLAHLIALQEHRSPSQIEQIENEMGGPRHFIFGKAKIEDIANGDNPHLKELLETVHILGPVIFYFKNHYNRVRPSFLRADLKPAIPNPQHPAYPSGHSAQAFFLYHLLSKLYPAQAKRFYKQAFEIALHREIAGVHYQSDSRAGEKLAQEVFNLMTEDQEFKSLLKHAVDWERQRQ